MHTWGWGKGGRLSFSFALGIAFYDWDIVS